MIGHQQATVYHHRRAPHVWRAARRADATVCGTHEFVRATTPRENSNVTFYMVTGLVQLLPGLKTAGL